MNIGVIGAGGWGIALSKHLDNNKNKVCLWSYSKEEVINILKFRENKVRLPGIKIPENVKITNCIEEAVKDKELILMAVPSKTIRENIKNISPYLKKGQIIVNASKGMEEDTFKTLTEVIKEVVPMCEVGALSGPSHAEELARCIPSTCVISFEKEKTAKYIQEVFSNNIFKIYTNTDIIGVEVGGALKNVIAIAMGILDGLNCGDNTKAFLLTRGMKEISDIGIKMGGNSNTFFGLSGLGDLIVTCLSKHSRNRKAGTLFAESKALDEVLKEVGMVVEGIDASRISYKLAIKYEIDAPIIKSVYNIIFNNKDPRDIINTLMKNEKEREFN